jgi:hypothetical protein
MNEKDAEPSINFENGSGANKVEGDMTLHGLLTGLRIRLKLMVNDRSK